MFGFLSSEVKIPEDQSEAIFGVTQTGYVEVYKAPRPTTLWHYTDAAALKGIVTEGTLRATSMGYLNDSSEYAYAVEVFRSVVLKDLDTATGDLRSLLDRIKDNLGTPDPVHYPPYFVACLSACEDSLSQWRGYGGGEVGFALGFHFEDLAKVFGNNNCLLAPVIYSRPEQERIVRVMLEKSAPLYGALAIPDGKDADLHINHWMQVFFYNLARIAPVFKHEGFKDEQEWRIVYEYNRDRVVNFLAKQTLLCPYVDVDLRAPTSEDQSVAKIMSLQKLIAGPGRMKHANAIAALAFLQTKGHGHVVVNESPLPFREL